MGSETRNIEAIEDVIDKVGLDGLLDLISDICLAKAEHLEDNWQDSPAAKRWHVAQVAFQCMKEKGFVRALTQE